MKIFDWFKLRGYTPTIPSDATKYLDGTGVWSVPPGGGSGDYVQPLVNTEVAITGAVTATISKQHACSGTTADYTVTLPAASGNTGKSLSFRMATGLTKLVTIDGNGSETIDGALTRIMWAGEAAHLYCDGSNWFKIGGKSIPMTTRLSRSTDQSFSANTWTACTFTAQDFGVPQMYDSGNSRLSIPRPSKYLVTCKMYVAATGATDGFAGAAVNATDPSPYYSLSAPVSSGATVTAVFTGEFDLAAADFVNLSANTDGTSPKFLGAGVQTITAIETVGW